MALIKYLKIVTRILRAFKPATLMFKSSPRLSIQVDYLLNLVGIYLHVYIFYKDCGTHISSVAQWCSRQSA